MNIIYFTSFEAWDVSWYLWHHLLLLLFRTPLREDFPNNEVVVFQPQTLTTAHLGSRHL